MIIQLTKFRKGNVLLEHTAKGTLKWSEVGQKLEVDDAIAHAVLGKYPDMLKEVRRSAAKKAPVVDTISETEAHEHEEKEIHVEATKMASEYANKSV